MELKGLTTLNLSGNNISDVSFLKEFKELTFLDLSGNNISDVSFLKELTELTSLDLSGNYLKDVTFLKELKGLENLVLSNNPISQPPIEIVGQGLTAIREYFNQEEKYGQDIVYEAKLLIIGEPDAGKTTLINKLFNPAHPVPDISQNSTLGVNVRTGLKYTHPKNNNINILTNTWDFGGQEIQYMLHQFFLTPDSLYLLVSDVRREDSRFDYWFQIIRLLGGKNIPVIVILNRINIDSVIHFPKEQFVKNFPELRIMEVELDFTKNDKRWELLLETIVTELAKLPVVGLQVPKPWKPIREELEELKEKKYISIEEYFSVCTKNGITEESDQLFLLNYFHCIGVALHFSGDERLQNKVYLSPNWITNGIYESLSEQVIKEKKGEFKKEWLFERLKENGYSYSEQGDILNLMLKDKFDICYELKDNPENYIVPLALPDMVPPFQLEEKEMLQFRLQYPFMPEGIISRLIVRLHSFIENNLVWKKGVILQRKGCHAEIIQTQSLNEGLKYIGIRVSGGVPDDKKSLLLLIRHEVENIHKTAFPGMVCSEMVVCNCHDCLTSESPYFYSYEDIKRYISKGKKTIECRKSIEDVPIKDLIGAVYYYEEVDEYAHKEKYGIFELESFSKIEGKLEELKSEMEEHGVDHKTIIYGINNLTEKITTFEHQLSNKIGSKNWEEYSDFIEQLNDKLLITFQEGIKELFNEMEKNVAYFDLQHEELFHEINKLHDWKLKLKFGFPLAQLHGIDVSVEHDIKLKELYDSLKRFLGFLQ
jgi:internalin A